MSRPLPPVAAPAIKPPPTSEIDSWCDEYLARLRAYPMPGRTRATDKAVLSALCHRCRLDQSRVFRASVREVAVIANKGTEAVGLSLSRLSMPADGRRALIVRHKNREETDTWTANQYELVLHALPPVGEESESVGSSRAAKLPVASLSTGDRSHDAYAPKRRTRTDSEADDRAADSLSASKQDVWAWLIDHPNARIAEVVRGTQVSADTALRALRSLQTLTMAEQDPETKRWTALTTRIQSDADLDPLALHAGTVGRTERKKRRHDREREAYELMRAEKAAERAKMEAWNAEMASWSVERLTAFYAELEEMDAATEYRLALRDTPPVPKAHDEATSMDDLEIDDPSLWAAALA